MDQKLKDKNIAILATDGFEEVELELPQDKLTELGANVHIISDKPILKSWHNKEWNKDFRVDRTLEKADVNDYDLLVLPGGVLNADKLRRNEKAVNWIKDFHSKNKYIAAICHGPLLLIEANLVKDKKLTSHHAIKTDMTNAGAYYMQNKVYKEEKFITAQGASDTEAFVDEIIEALTE